MNEDIRNPGSARKADTHERYLAFQLSDEQYAIPLLQVKEVIEMTEPTPLPRTLPHFRGIINLRGQIISVMDLRVKLQIPDIKNGPKTAIIILDLESGTSLGVIVDRINSVQAFQHEDIGAAPETHGASTDQCIMGVARRDKKMTLLLDIKSALSLQDLKMAQQMTSIAKKIA